MRTRVTFSLIIATLALVVSAASAVAGPSPARGKLIHRSIDPVSGATIRLYQLTPSDMTMEVVAGEVTVTKRFGAKSSDVSIETKTDRIAFAVTPVLLLVSRQNAQLRLTQATADAQRAPLERFVRASAAYRDGIALLKRVKVGERSPLKMLILPLRAFLEGATGDASARVAMTQWARAMRSTPRMVRTGLQDKPGDCWQLYSQEAIEAWMELEDCLANAPWKAWPWTTNCHGIYDIRAIGAAIWYLSCVGIST